MNNKKHILSCLLCIFTLAAISQTTSFNKVFSLYNNNPNTSFISGAIVHDGSGYIVAAKGYDTINNNNNMNLYFFRVDSVGNFKLISKHIKENSSYYSGFGSLIRTKNDGFCFVGDIDSNNMNIGQHFMMRFNSNMDTLWTKIIPHDTVFEAVRQVKETYDGGFIIVGQRSRLPGVLDVLLIKTDSLGNQLWKRTIVTGNRGNGWQIEETPDKGFLICGYRRSNTIGDGDPFIIKTDSLGNLLWKKFLGGNELDGGAAIAVTREGDYLVAFGYSTYTEPSPFVDTWFARLNVIKYSSNGNQIWNKMYDTIRREVSINKIQILPDNSFVVMGSATELDYHGFYIAFNFKFNSNGDSLWRKIYFYSGNSGDQNILWDNTLSTDGSIAACGYVSCDTMVPSFKIWVLKTDTNGYAPGCYPTGVEEYYYTQKGELKIFPNPATTQTTIIYKKTKPAKPAKNI